MRGHRVDHDGAMAFERTSMNRRSQRLLAGIGLGDEHVVDSYPRPRRAA